MASSKQSSPSKSASDISSACLTCEVWRRARFSKARRPDTDGRPGIRLHQAERGRQGCALSASTEFSVLAPHHSQVQGLTVQKHIQYHTIETRRDDAIEIRQDGKNTGGKKRQGCRETERTRTSGEGRPVQVAQGPHEGHRSITETQGCRTESCSNKEVRFPSTEAARQETGPGPSATQIWQSNRRSSVRLHDGST